MPIISHVARRMLLAAAMTAVGLGAGAASSSASASTSCLCFHAVYRATTGFIHDSAFNVTTRSWSDQIAPGSVPAKTDPYAVKTADNRYHIVYVGTDGFVHDDFEDPATKAFTDLIPVGSVKAAPVVPAVTDFVDATHPAHRLRGPGRLRPQRRVRPQDGDVV